MTIKELIQSILHYSKEADSEDILSFYCKKYNEVRTNLREKVSCNFALDHKEAYAMIDNEMQYEQMKNIVN